MNPLDDLDPQISAIIRAKIASRLVSDRMATYFADDDLSPSQRREALARDVPELRDDAAVAIATAEAVAAGSTPEAVAARVDAQKAVASREERRFRTGAASVERRIDLRKATERVERERRELAWREEAFARLEKSDCPPGELLISEGAVEMARARVAEAERALSAAQSGK